MTATSIAWFDGTAGASGDMLLGAFVDAGVPIDVPASAIDALDIGVTLEVEVVQRGSLAASRVHVKTPDTSQVRHLADIVEMFDMLDADLARLAAEVFARLARAEAAVHGTSIDEVHFHEVGALDSIADVVGAAACLRWLNLERIHCSTLSLGSGRSRGTHGPLPIPAPAVLELVRGEVPVSSGPAPFESTTPTGAAVLVSVVDEWSPMPPMTVHSVGLGAGHRDSDDVVNALRLVLGERAENGARGRFRR